MTPSRPVSSFNSRSKRFIRSFTILEMSTRNLPATFRVFHKYSTLATITEDYVCSCPRVVTHAKNKNRLLISEAHLYHLRRHAFALSDPLFSPFLHLGTLSLRAKKNASDASPASMSDCQSYSRSGWLDIYFILIDTEYVASNIWFRLKKSAVES